MGFRDDLEEAGNRPGMEDLEGKVFQVVSPFEIGRDKSAFSDGDYFFADLDLIVEDEAGTYETQQRFTGRRVIGQLIMIKQRDMVPIRLTLLRRDDLPGHPWWLRAVDGEENEDSPLVQAAVKAGAKKLPKADKTEKPLADPRPFAEKIADPLLHFRLSDGSLDFGKFVETLERQPEKFTRYELESVLGAYSTAALEHWFKAEAGRTITTLKQAILTAREAAVKLPPAEEMPFE